MAKNDTITVGIRNGETLTSISVRAAQNGRRVEQETAKDNGIVFLTIRELTRGGTIIQETKAQLTDVVYVSEIRGHKDAR